MIPERRVLDVSKLPTTGFGPATLVWWGTIGFMVIEGFTLLIATASYLYLRTNQYEWPPPPHPDPDLLLPSVSLLLLLAVIIPMRRVDRAARRYDREGVARGLLIATLTTIPVLVLRWFDILALNVRWDTNAYSSAAWAIVVLHGTLLVVDLFETGSMWVLFRSGRAERKHYSDATDAALYQYFLSLGWIPLYLIVYWGPRVL